MIGKEFWNDMKNHDFIHEYQKNNIPTMLLYSEKDTIIDRQSVSDTYDLMNCKKEFRVLKDTSHNLKPDLETNIKIISNWFKKTLY